MRKVGYNLCWWRVFFRYFSYIWIQNKTDVYQTYTPKIGYISLILSGLYTSWMQLSYLRISFHNEFAGYFFWVLKRKGFSLQVFRLKSCKVYFQTFDNVKDLAKLLKINDKVNILSSKTENLKNNSARKPYY